MLNLKGHMLTMSRGVKLLQGGSSLKMPSRFLAFLLTVITVYLVAPWLATLVLSWLPVEHPDRIRAGVALLAMFGAYNILRRLYGDRLPRV
jgi:hypothetical protein